MPIWRLLIRPLSLKQVDNLPPRRTITEESFLFRFGLPHAKLAVGASGSRDAYFSLYP